MDAEGKRTFMEYHQRTVEDFRQRAYEHYRTMTSRQQPLRVSTMNLEAKVRQFRQRWSRVLPQDRDAPILDIGCGGGEFLYFLHQEGFTNIYGIDVSPEQVEAARALGLQRVELGDAGTYLEEHTGSFQVIAALSLLEHLTREEMLVLLDGVVKALRPGGLLLPVMPNSLSVFGARIRYGDITHEQSFTPESIVQICAMVGLEPMSILEWGPVVHGIASGLRWLAWQVIRGFILFYPLVESADCRWRVYTQDMRVIARKP